MTEQEPTQELERSNLYGKLDLNKLAFDIDEEFRKIVESRDVVDPIVLVVNHDFLAWCHQEDNAFWEYISGNEFYQLVSSQNQFMPLIRGIMLGGNYHVGAPTEEEIEQLDLSEDEEVPEKIMKLQPNLNEDTEVHFHLKDYTLEDGEEMTDA